MESLIGQRVALVYHINGLPMKTTEGTVQKIDGHMVLLTNVKDGKLDQWVNTLNSQFVRFEVVGKEE